MADTVIMFDDLYLEPNENISAFTYKGKTVNVKQYLPIEEKAELVSYVLNHAIDLRTNTFSPLRVSVYLTLGIINWYSNINFEPEQLEEKAPEVFDLIDGSKFLELFLDNMENTEFEYMNKTVAKVLKDYETYANSMVGMISAMSSDASSMNKEIEEIMTKIKNKEGLEELAVIKDIVG